MLKHTIPFLISLLLHTLLFGGFYLICKKLSNYIQTPEESMVCIQLCALDEKKELLTPLVPSVVKVQKIKKKKLLKKVKKRLKKEPKKVKTIKKKVVKVVVPVAVEEVPKESEIVVTPQKTQLILNPKPMPSPEVEYVEKNLAKIIELLQENLYYPRRARKRGVEGEVVVRFLLTTSAEVKNIKIISSKSEILSRGAIKTIENLSFKFPKPTEALDLSVPIVYTLE